MKTPSKQLAEELGRIEENTDAAIHIELHTRIKQRHADCEWFLTTFHLTLKEIKTIEQEMKVLEETGICQKK